MMVLRTFVYNLVFYTWIALSMILAAPAFLIGRRAAMQVVRWWTRIAMGLHSVITGIRHEYRGFDRIPSGGVIIAAKHQSTWETLALVGHLEDPAFVLKRELTRIPLFGWWILKVGMIPVDRDGGMKALAAMARDCRAAVEAGRQVLIFPEGTRREAGAPPDYKPGLAFLYKDLKVPIVPVALNSGAAWPRHSRAHRRGTIVAEVLDPIPAGLDPREALQRTKDAIEAACDRLLLEADARGDDLPALARARVAELKG